MGEIHSGYKQKEKGEKLHRILTIEPQGYCLEYEIEL